MMDPEFLHELSQTSIAAHGNNTAKIIDFIVTNLTETYGSRYINPRQDEWVLNNAGGAMGTARVAISFHKLAFPHDRHCY
jgi:C-8 sterol isomerase